MLLCSVAGSVFMMLQGFVCVVYIRKGGTCFVSRKVQGGWHGWKPVRQSVLKSFKICT